VTILLFILCLSPLIAEALGRHWLDVSSVWYVAFVIAFLACYSLAYMRGELDMVYVNVHTIVSDRFPSGAQQVKPVVYYWDREGNQCLQEQTYAGIFKALLFGIRSPLRLDTGMVRRTRPVYVQKVLYPIVRVDAIDVVEEKVEESIVRKGPFGFRVRSYSYTPAPSCIDTTQNWLVSAYNQRNLMKELTRKEAQLLETKTTAMSQFYARSADLLVEMINDRTPGAEVYQDVVDRLAPGPEEIRIQAEDPPAELPKKPKKKGILGRRKEADTDERFSRPSKQRSAARGLGLPPGQQHLRGHPLREGLHVD
jgi:uncharacterized membrane-anchored protein YhcB (DUF1043 family)